MKAKLILVLLITIGIVNSQFKCGSDRKTIIPKAVKNREPTTFKKTRRLAGSAFRFYLDKSALNAEKGANPGNKDIIDNALFALRAVTEDLSTIFELKDEQVAMSFQMTDINTTCKVTKYSPDLITGIDADLVIFPQLDQTLKGSETLASAEVCLYSAVNERPTAGVLNINPDLLFDKTNSLYRIKIIMMHEVLHLLGFANHFFTGKKATKEINGIERTVINSANVLKALKKHLNCSGTLDGVPLESADSNHWSPRFMFGDIMNSGFDQEIVLSEITLAFFEDLGCEDPLCENSGWYNINKYTGGLFKFGKGKGCGFITETCIKDEEATNEFCATPGALKCTPSRTGRGACNILNHESIPAGFQYFNDTKAGGLKEADYCPLVQNMTSNHTYKAGYCRVGDKRYAVEELGQNTFCFMSNLNSGLSYYPSCHKVECDFTSFKYKVYFGEEIIECGLNDNNKNITGFTGEFYCADFNSICTAEKTCNDIFDCIHNQSTPYEHTNEYDYDLSEVIIPPETDSRLEDVDSGLRQVVVIPVEDSGKKKDKKDNKKTILLATLIPIGILVIAAIIIIILVIKKVIPDPCGWFAVCRGDKDESKDEQKNLKNNSINAKQEEEKKLEEGSNNPEVIKNSNPAGKVEIYTKQDLTGNN